VSDSESTIAERDDFDDARDVRRSAGIVLQRHCQLVACTRDESANSGEPEVAAEPERTVSR
jgi:hypothetical protein